MRLADARFVLLVAWGYGYLIAVLTSAGPRTVPGSVYLHYMKPASLLLFILLYLFVIAGFLSSGRTNHPVAYIAKVLLATSALLVAVIAGYTDIYKYLGVAGPGGVIYQDPATCFYFSVVTFTTLGYGDFHPTEGARIFAASEAVLGYVMMGVAVAVVVATLATVANSESGSFRQIRNQSDGDIL